MTFRVRVLVAGAALALTPLAILAIGVRREARARLAAQYRQQGEAVVARAHDALRRESDRVAQRLTRLRGAIADDNRFRLALASSPPVPLSANAERGDSYRSVEVMPR